MPMRALRPLLLSAKINRKLCIPQPRSKKALRGRYHDYVLRFEFFACKFLVHCAWILVLKRCDVFRPSWVTTISSWHFYWSWNSQSIVMLNSDHCLESVFWTLRCCMASGIFALFEPRARKAVGKTHFVLHSNFLVRFARPLFLCLLTICLICAQVCEHPQIQLLYRITCALRFQMIWMCDCGCLPQLRRTLRVWRSGPRYLDTVHCYGSTFTQTLFYVFWPVETHHSVWFKWEVNQWSVYIS